MMPGDPVVGGTVLRRAAVQSPNYVSGSSGWTINADGSAEFNNLAIRGTFDGTDFIINASGAFFYDGTPASGNLIISLAPAAGTDGFGNAYTKGIQLGEPSASALIRMIPGLSGHASQIQFYDPTGTLSNEPNIAAGLGGSSSDMVLSGPALVTAGSKDWVQLALESNDGSGTGSANMEFIYVDTSGAPQLAGAYNRAKWEFAFPVQADQGADVTGGLTCDELANSGTASMLTGHASVTAPTPAPSRTVLGSTWNATTANQCNNNFVQIINTLGALGLFT